MTTISISSTLRERVTASGLTHSEIAKRSKGISPKGISRSHVSEFMRGVKGMTLEKAEILAQVVGYRLLLDAKEGE